MYTFQERGVIEPHASIIPLTLLQRMVLHIEFPRGEKFLFFINTFQLSQTQVEFCAAFYCSPFLIDIFQISARTHQANTTWPLWCVFNFFCEGPEHC